MFFLDVQINCTFIIYLLWKYINLYFKYKYYCYGLKTFCSLWKYMCMHCKEIDVRLNQMRLNKKKIWQILFMIYVDNKGLILRLLNIMVNVLAVKLCDHCSYKESENMHTDYCWRHIHIPTDHRDLTWIFNQRLIYVE